MGGVIMMDNTDQTQEGRIEEAIDQLSEGNTADSDDLDDALNWNTENDNEESNMSHETERTIPIGKEDLTRIFDYDEAVTFEFDYAPSVTLVSERNRRKWEQHDRPQDAGDVFFLTAEDDHRVRYSHTGFLLGDSNVRIVIEWYAESTADA